MLVGSLSNRNLARLFQSLTLFGCLKRQKWGKTIVKSNSLIGIDFCRKRKHLRNLVLKSRVSFTFRSFLPVACMLNQTCAAWKAYDQKDTKNSLFSYGKKILYSVYGKLWKKFSIQFTENSGKVCHWYWQCLRHNKIFILNVRISTSIKVNLTTTLTAAFEGLEE